VFIQNILCFIPIFDFFKHYFFAIGTNVVEVGGVALAGFFNDLLCLFIYLTSAIIFKFESDKEVSLKPLKILMKIFRTNIPASAF
jgi:hypothetical protein